MSMANANTVDDRRHAVTHGLLPIMRIAEQPLHWTMDERLAHHGCPGASVAVMRDGRIDWVDGFGFLEAAVGPTPCGPDTMYLVASCSKPVTAMLVLQQVERGVLDLDADVNRYLRRWQVPGNDFTAQQPVTLRHILSHTAGLSVNGWGVVPRDGRPVPSVLDLLEGHPPSHEAPVRVDKAFDGVDRYSGGGYLIAQCVVEDVLGESFADVAQRMLFGPLRMTRTTYHFDPARFGTDIASGHGDDGAPAPGGWMITPEMGAGGLISTARDYATFLLACGAAYRGEPGAILGHSLAVEAMTRFQRSTFGLGFRVLGDGVARRVNHGGSNDGYQSETNAYLETGEGAVVLTNATSGLFLYREVLNGIADVYDWPEFMPAPKHLRTLTADEQIRYVGQYRIVSGIELPLLRVWVENGTLLNQVPGLRFGVQEVFCDIDGVLFNQTGPFETRVVFGDDGRAQELNVTEGDVLVLRAVRTEP